MVESPSFLLAMDMHFDTFWTPNRKPRIELLVDVYGWAFHILALGIQRHLNEEFDIHISVISEKPVLDDSAFDILHVFHAQETYHRQFLTGKSKVIKSLYNHYWQSSNLLPEQAYDSYLREAHALIVPNISLLEFLRNLPTPVFLVPEGVDTALFVPGPPRNGPFVAGWAGNIARPLKRFQFVKEACDGICDLLVADGSLSQEEMVNFYHDIDIILCSSESEACPRPVIEAMSCGRFPVSFRVGIVPEVVRSGVNGLIIEEQSADALRKAVVWCKDHLSTVRGVRRINSEIIRASRDWSLIAKRMSSIYNAVL